MPDITVDNTNTELETASLAPREQDAPQEVTVAESTGIDISGGVAPGSLPQGSQQIHPNHHDIYYWHALYSDGTSLLEVEGDILRGFHEIDQDRLVGFLLHPTLQGYPQYGVELGENKRLVFVRRRTTTYNPNDSTMSYFVWHILGYQQTVESTNVKSLTFINMEGNSFMTDNPNPELQGQ